MMVSVDDAIASYTSWSKEDQEKMLSHIKLANRKNASWKEIAPKVKAFAIEKKRFSINDLKDAGIVQPKTPKQNFVKCLMPILEKEGFTLIEQKGVLPRNGSLFHIKGHALLVEEKGQTFFEEPNREAAKFFADSILKDKNGRVNIVTSLKDENFGFVNNTQKVRQFRLLVADEGGKSGWRSDSNHKYLTKKEESN